MINDFITSCCGKENTATTSCGFVPQFSAASNHGKSGFSSLVIYPASFKKDKGLDCYYYDEVRQYHIPVSHITGT
jgi:hypothetical protein